MAENGDETQKPTEPTQENTEPRLEATPIEPSVNSPTGPTDGPTLGAPAPLIEAPKPHWKQQLRSLGSKVVTRVKQNPKLRQWGAQLATRIQEFEPAMAAAWAGKTFQQQKAGLYGSAATIALCSFFVADLLALLLGRYIPEPPVARLTRNSTYRRAKMLDDYNIVFTRNLFSSLGIVPGEEAQGPSTPTDQGGPPVKSSLPLNLIGTLLMLDEMRSIATIEDKSASIVYPVRQLDEIPSKIRVIKIDPRRVTFTNIATGRREYIELPDDGTPLSVGTRVSVGIPGKGGIEKVSATQYNIQRSEVDNALKDLNKVLTEARAVPNFENGAPAGYKLFQIVPGSIYDKLGLQNGDIITGLNGAVINDPGKAFEMLTELKTSNHLELQVKKDGRVQTYNYDIR